MFDSQKGPGRRRPSKNVFTTKSGKTIKLNRSLGERVRAGREAKARKRAAYMSTLPRNRWKRILYRMHPKRVAKYWFSKEGAIMALKLMGVGIVAFFLLMVGIFAYFRKDLPNIKDISGNELGGSINYYDRSGQTLLWQDYASVKRVPVTSDKISKYVKDATIATEDKNFYKHGAFDVQGIARAGFNDIFNKGGGTQGGSTITQQLVKLNQNWTSDRSITRKFKELILAVELEREYSKEDILTGYLNVAPYGGVGYGVETAANDYFGVAAKDLTIPQAAMLASIPKAPDHYGPYSDNFVRADLLARQRYVIDQMASQGMISKKDAEDAKAVDVLAQLKAPQPKYGTNIKAPYFVLAAKGELEATYGPSTVKRGGWKVVTTLDMGLQKTAEDLVSNNMKNITSRTRVTSTTSLADQQALVTEDVPTGQIVSLVGGVDFSNPDYGQNNYAAGILIPPGSSFKPYDYAIFIDNNNAGAGSVLYDTQGPLPGYPCTIKGSPKTEKNANCLWDYDLQYPGPVTLRYALGGSRNVPAVKAMLSAVPNDNSVGKVDSINKVISTASAMMANQHSQRAYNCYADEALTQTTQCYGAAAIGDGAFLRLDDHVNGLATLGRLGSAIPRTYILKITDSSNKKLYEWKQPQGKQVIKADSAYITNNMMSDPKASYLPGNCTDSNCTRLSNGGYKFHRFNGWDFAIKTGTTNNGFDGLMTSWSTKYAVVSWVGNHMRNKDISMNSRVSMEQLTEPLARGMMEAAHTNLKASNWTKPGTVQTLPAYVIGKKVSRLGEIIPSTSTDLYPAWYKQATNQGGSSQTIDKVSGKLVSNCTPEAAKQVTSNANDNMFSADIFTGVRRGTSAPTEQDDVHKCEDAKPSVTLSAPATCTVGSPCALTVTVTQGTHALTSDKFPGSVDLYINDQKIESQPISASPSTVTFNYTPTGNGNMKVEARATDSVLYNGSESTNVSIQ